MTGTGKRLAARLRVTVGVTPTVPRLACPLVALDVAKTGVGAGPDEGAGAGKFKAAHQVSINQLKGRCDIGVFGLLGASQLVTFPHGADVAVID